MATPPRHSPVDVRVARADDRGEITRLVRQLHPDSADGSSLPRVRQEARTFVATEEDGLVGLAVATLVDYGVEAYGSIEELVVDAPGRGRGIGTALLAQCREWLTEAGAEVVFVSAKDDEAVSFYVGAGFVHCRGPWLFWTPHPSG